MRLFFLGIRMLAETISAVLLIYSGLIGLVLNLGVFSRQDVANRVAELVMAGLLVWDAMRIRENFEIFFVANSPPNPDPISQREDLLAEYE